MLLAQVRLPYRMAVHNGAETRQQQSQDKRPTLREEGRRETACAWWPAPAGSASTAPLGAPALLSVCWGLRHNARTFSSCQPNRNR